MRYVIIAPALLAVLVAVPVQAQGCPAADADTVRARVQQSPAFQAAQHAAMRYVATIARVAPESASASILAQATQTATALCDQLIVAPNDVVPGLRMASVLIVPGYIARYAVFAVTPDTVMLINRLRPSGDLDEKFEPATWNAVVQKVPGGFHIDSAKRASNYVAWLASMIPEFVFPFSCAGESWAPTITGGPPWGAAFYYCREGKPPRKRWLSIEFRRTGEITRMVYDSIGPEH